jgi:hypothetical protein
MWKIEETDTFGGEANYSWVNRWKLPNGLTKRQVVCRAKKLAGWTGLRCRTTDLGLWIEVAPIGKYSPCIIMFIRYEF